MPVKIYNPSASRFAKCLFFSPPGHGKTRLLGTAVDDPRTFPMCLLDYEGGTSTLVGKNIDIIKIRSMDDYEEAYNFLKSGKHPYKSIGLDSVSETHINALLTQLDSQDRRRSIPDLLEQGDYGVALTKMRRLLRRFRDLPYHFFATCAMKEEEEARDGKVKKPALAGALADEAPGIFEMVAYLALSEDEDGEVERVLVLGGVPKIRSKVRLPWDTPCPDFLVDPTVTKILNLLQIPDSPIEEEPPKTEIINEEVEEEEEEESPPEPKKGPATKSFSIGSKKANTVSPKVKKDQEDTTPSTKEEESMSVQSSEGGSTPSVPSTTRRSVSTKPSLKIATR